MFNSTLGQILNPKHTLVLLADEIPWHEFDQQYKHLYSNTGLPAKPIRLMVGLLILKQLKDLSDEQVVIEWVQNPYFQYFCGESEFKWTTPCDPSDLTHFRNRIGKDQIEKILEVSIKIQPEAQSLKKMRKLVKAVTLDTTAQEKNITYPTDVKLRKKIIDTCRKIAKQEGIELRQSYTRTAKRLMLAQRFAHHPKNWNKAEKAKRKLRTIAGRLVRELERKVSRECLKAYRDQLDIFKSVLLQRKKDSQKIYSLHEPQVGCIAKGKVAKKFEFGSKVSIATSKDGNVVLGVVNYTGNPHDSKTIEDTLAQVERLTGQKVEEAVVDRGYRSKKIVSGTRIIKPDPLKSTATAYEKAKMRQCFRRRAAIEPIIGHMKNNYRMKRNYLKGEQGDVINAVLSGAAFNFKRWLNQKLREVSGLIRNWTINLTAHSYNQVLLYSSC
jgi:IS5 family transposase